MMTTQAMRNRARAMDYVAFVVDDSGNGRELGADIHAIVREQGQGGFEHASVLVGWQCGFEPLYVAVHSCLYLSLTDEEAEELAADYLEERGWFGNHGRVGADYIIR
jgi:hypothetical protein